MATVIRVDDEVMKALRSLAIRWELVFSSPNQVLRRLLDLEDGRDQLREVQPTSSTYAPVQLPSVLSEVGSKLLRRRIRGQKVLKLHPSLCGQGLTPYADRDGKFYHWPNGFPAIFFDQDGYVIFKSEQGMLATNQYLTAHEDIRKLHIRDGISSLPRYIECPPSCHRSLWTTPREMARV